MANAPFINAKRYMGLALETIPGTAVTPTSDDFDIAFYDIQVDPQIETMIREVATGRHTKVSALMGKRKIVIKAKHELSIALGDPTLFSADKVFSVLGCPSYAPDPNYDATGTGTLWVVYPNPDQGKAVVLKAKGVKADAQVTGHTGGPFILDVTFTGALSSIDFVDSGDVPVYTEASDVLVPPVILSAGTSATTSMDGNQRNIGEFTLSLGNAVELYEDASDSSGYSYAYISKRDPKVSLKPVMDLFSGADPVLEKWMSGEEMAITISTPDTTSSIGVGFTEVYIQLSIPKAQSLAHKFEDRNGALAGGVDMELHESEGGDEWSFLCSGIGGV